MAAYDLLKVETNPIRDQGRAQPAAGREVGGVRLPLVEATKSSSRQVRSCLERLLSALVPASSFSFLPRDQPAARPHTLG